MQKRSNNLRCHSIRARDQTISLIIFLSRAVATRKDVAVKGVLNPNFRPFNFELNKKIDF